MEWEPQHSVGLPTSPVGGSSTGLQREFDRGQDSGQAHLERTGGKIYGPGGAAEILDIKPSTLQSRMQKLGVALIASHQRRPTP